MIFDFPRPEKPVICNKHGSFAAFGALPLPKFEEVSAVRCELIGHDENGEELDPFTGLALYQPFGNGLWAVAFDRVLDDGPNNPYTLRLFSDDPPLPDPLDEIAGIRLALAEGPGITYPGADGVTVTATYTAYGDTDSSVQQANSYMTYNNVNTTGSVRNKNGSWWLTFTGLNPAGGTNPWTLTVTDGSGPSTRNNLTVQ